MKSIAFCMPVRRPAAGFRYKVAMNVPDPTAIERPGERGCRSDRGPCANRGVVVIALLSAMGKRLDGMDAAGQCLALMLPALMPYFLIL